MPQCFCWLTQAFAKGRGVLDTDFQDPDFQGWGPSLGL
jgi:hypothetical protein